VCGRPTQPRDVKLYSCTVIVRCPCRVRLDCGTPHARDSLRYTYVLYTFVRSCVSCTALHPAVSRNAVTGGWDPFEGPLAPPPSAQSHARDRSGQCVCNMCQGPNVCGSCADLNENVLTHAPASCLHESLPNPRRRPKPLRNRISTCCCTCSLACIDARIICTAVRGCCLRAASLWLRLQLQSNKRAHLRNRNGAYGSLALVLVCLFALSGNVPSFAHACCLPLHQCFYLIQLQPAFPSLQLGIPHSGAFNQFQQPFAPCWACQTW
jgi:hypothetical protein